MRYLFSVLLLALSFNLQAVDSSSRLNWISDYEQALQQAKLEKKPLLLFFTGSDWCSWCHKLENEVLNTMEFSDLVGDRFIFVVVDFPLKNQINSPIANQNKALQKKFGVKGFPTLILLDTKQNKIGEAGYREGGAKPYANYLLKMVKDYGFYKQKISQLSPKNLLDTDLYALYGKACELCLQEEAEKILTLGIKLPDNSLFLLEKYKKLAASYKIHSAEAQTIRHKLLKINAANQLEIPYKIALIDFETFLKELETKDYAPELVIAPLTHYIENFGKQDLENTWRLHLSIAQVYLDKEQYKQAFFSIKNAYNLAPLEMQAELQTFMHNLQTFYNYSTSS